MVKIFIGPLQEQLPGLMPLILGHLRDRATNMLHLLDVLVYCNRPVVLRAIPVVQHTIVSPGILAGIALLVITRRLSGKIHSRSDVGMHMVRAVLIRISMSANIIPQGTSYRSGHTK